MKEFLKSNFTVNEGVHIGEACEEAINIANKIDRCVEFEFNGVNCTINPSDKREDVVKSYWNQIQADYSLKKQSAAEK